MKTKRDLTPGYIKRILAPMPENVRSRCRPILEVSGPAFGTEENRVMRRMVRQISETYRFEKAAERLAH